MDWRSGVSWLESAPVAVVVVFSWWFIFSTLVVIVGGMAVKSANPKHTNSPYKISVLAKAFVGVNLRMSRMHDMGIYSINMKSKKNAVDTFWPIKLWIEA